MPRGNPAVKLAVTVDAEVHSHLKRAAKADGVSVSAWLTAAARRALQIRDGLAAVAEWETEHGSFSETELAAARARVAKRGSRERARR